MQRTIKTLDQLKIEADYRRLGRVEQAILEAIVEDQYGVDVQDSWLSEFVQAKLIAAGYAFYPSKVMGKQTIVLKDYQKKVGQQ